MNDDIEYEYYQLTAKDVLDWIIRAIAEIKFALLSLNRKIDQIVDRKMANQKG